MCVFLLLSFSLSGSVSVSLSLSLSLSLAGAYRCHLLPLASTTRAEKGAKDVRIAGYGDKRQITAIAATTMDGQTLPLQVSASASASDSDSNSNSDSDYPQVILQGKTKGCYKDVADKLSETAW